MKAFVSSAIVALSYACAAGASLPLPVGPASVRLVRDDTVRPNGTALKIRVATAGHATGVNEKNSTEITLTEFPDVGATATYFRVSDLSQAEEDGLFK